MLDTGKRYFDAHAVTDKKARHNSQEADVHMPGAPHHYVWCTLILQLIKTVQVNKLPPHLEKDLAQLKAHCVEVKNPTQLEDAVQVCRVSRAFKQGEAK
eukprot:4456244-Heterocapsa_arctica.AAC.1